MKLYQKKLKEKGITLVALVVTIVIMLILAGVTLGLVGGENGLFNMTRRTAEKYKEMQTSEDQEIKQLEAYLADVIKERPAIIVSQLHEWTKSKEVRMQGIEDCKIKYTINGEEPGIEIGEEYKEKIVINKNCTIKAIYIKDNEIYGRISQEKITHIDKEEPEILDINLTPDKKSVQINVNNVEDNKETEESGSSGIAAIRARLSKDGSTWSEYQNVNIKTNKYTFDNIYGDLAGQTCKIQVEAKDYAGNTKLVEKTATTTCKQDHFYTNTAGELIATVNGFTYGNLPFSRNYNKYNNEGAIAASYYYHDEAYNVIGSTVILVGVTEESVMYNPNCFDEIATYRNKVNYHGTEYFVSNDLYVVETRADGSMKSDFPILNTYSNPYMLNSNSPNHINEYTEIVYDMLDKYFG